jgi:type I restriction enzyme S subunit
MGIRLLQLADIGDGQFLDKSNRYISELKFNQLNCKEVVPGDIIISRMAEPIGRACIIPNTGTKMITAVDCTIVRVNTEAHDVNYWLNFTNTNRWRQLVASKAGGTTRVRISRKNLENLIVPIPPLEYQFDSSTRMRGIQQLIEMSETHTRQIKLLYSTLLNSLLL